MDKKKVEKLIGELRSVIYDTNGKEDVDEANLTIALAAISKIESELSKSDWVSVEDGLPEYGEKVFAYDKEMPDYPFVTMRYKAGKEKLIDKNGFRSGLHVTHWKPIEKLEE